MWPKEMTNDLIITQAENNKEFRIIKYEEGYIASWVSFFLGLILLWGIL